MLTVKNVHARTDKACNNGVQSLDAESFADADFI
jgi:hypothetical protein